MALYDYKCPKCNTVETVQHSINDTSPQLCTCGEEMRKVYHAPGVTFNGEGWGKDAR